MNIKYIKSYIASKIGTKVVVICYYSRNKKERFNGVIFNVYPKVFTVRLDDGMIKSFNYVDIIAKNISNAVFICHGGTIGTILELFYDNSKNFYQWQPRCGEGYKIVVTGKEKIEIIDVERIFEV